jgi:hypothetical protein
MGRRLFLPQRPGAKGRELRKQKRREGRVRLT